MPEIVIKIDTDEALEYCRQHLAGVSDSRIRMAVRTAINRTAKDAKEAEENAAKAIYTDPGHLNEFNFKKASVGDLMAILKDRGGAVRMDYFVVNGSTGPNTGTVTRALINRNHGYKTIGKHGNKAFVNPPPRVRVRTGKGRHPLETMFSVSSPSAHGSPDTTEAAGLQEIGQDQFMAHVREEVVKILGGL